jgi:uncharacterized double-CXXCG motif protein
MPTLYQLTLDENDWYRYQIEGSHRWSLPPLSCDTCGSTWGTVGEEYPAADLTTLADASAYERSGAVGNVRFEQLRERIRPLVPAEALLRPGTSLGPFVGTAKGTFFDFAWQESWTMLLQEDALLRLHAAGIRMPRCGVPRLSQRGKREIPALVEPEAVPLVEVVRESLDAKERPRCQRCGYKGGRFRMAGVGVDVSVPRDVDIFRARNLPGIYLATERFAEAVRSLGLTGCILKSLPIIPATAVLAN